MVGKRGELQALTDCYIAAPVKNQQRETSEVAIVGLYELRLFGGEYWSGSYFDLTLPVRQ